MILLTIWLLGTKYRPYKNSSDLIQVLQPWVAVSMKIKSKPKITKEMREKARRYGFYPNSVS